MRLQPPRFIVTYVKSVRLVFFGKALVKNKIPIRLFCTLFLLEVIKFCKFHFILWKFELRKIKLLKIRH